MYVGVRWDVGGSLGFVRVVCRAIVSIEGGFVGGRRSLRDLLIILEVGGGVDLHESFDVDGVVAWGDYAVAVEKASREVVCDLYSPVVERYA